MLIQQLINGLTLGSIYALIALGYTMVYGILMMINFAHSEIFMAGAFAGFYMCALFLGKLQNPHLSPHWALSFGKHHPYAVLLLTFIFSFVFAGALAFLVERIAYRPLRRAPRLMPLISAIGVSIILQNVVMLFVSPQYEIFPPVLKTKILEYGQKGFHIVPMEKANESASFSLSTTQALIMFTSVALMFILQFFIARTKMGKAMRATANDMETAGLMGISVNRIISLTFFIGGGLGGVAGVLNGLYYGSIKYNMGFLPGIKAFTCAVLGGIGNIPGAMLGGYLLGILESLGAGFIPGGAQWKDVIAFCVLILVLIVRPSGILGEQVSEKV